jgi:signal peptidase II
MIYLVALLTLLIDQITKYLILKKIELNQVVSFCPFFNLVSVRNRGVSFSFLSGDSPLMPWILSGMALIICIGLVIWLEKEKCRWTRIGLSLVLGGAIGNVIDRIRFGAVIDFLDFYIGKYHWPAFNMADSAICLGVFIILYQTFRKDKK